MNYKQIIHVRHEIQLNNRKKVKSTEIHRKFISEFTRIAKEGKYIPEK